MRQLISVTVTGSKRYPQSDIVAATGLQIGTTVVEDDFKKAARRLGDLGVFSDIVYNYSYSSAGTKLVLQVTDIDKFVPVRFEDFVWFSDAELTQRIKERAPMFNGELPLSGAGSFALHALVVGFLLLWGLYLYSYFNKPSRNLPVESVRLESCRSRLGRITGLVGGECHSGQC